jgi:hypothetical protein
MYTANDLFPEGTMRFENGILHLEYRPNVLIDMNVLYRQIKCRESLTKDKDFYMVVDLRNNVDVTDEAIEFTASHPSPDHIKGIAMLTRYGMDYTRAKLFSVFDRPNIKTRAVLSLEGAKAWFESLEQPVLRKAG